MNLVLINPNMIVQRSDPFTSGIVYMPVGLAYAASALRAAGFAVGVVDAFGEAPRRATLDGKFMRLGLTPEEVLARIPAEARVAMIYAMNVTNHNAALGILRAVKAARPEIKVVILENTQAVTAYALAEVKDQFFAAGADYLLSGEAERRAVLLALSLADGRAPEAGEIDGLGAPGHYTPPEAMIDDLDALPFPAWEMFPLENYWSLRFAHAPLTGGRYLPLLTSRGCPYPCRFCVIPATNRRRWRARSAANVVDEIDDALHRYGVSEFHIEDVDPTISEERTRAICEEILRRGLKVTWKIGAGTKVETLRSDDTIDLMARAGCRYISISPETGSPRLLKAMQKPFDLEHAERIVRRMGETGISSQACFILGFPGETAEDRRMTWDLVHRMTKFGVDEIALFIITPVPGAAIYPEMQGYQSLSDLTFSPVWRQDYRTLAQFRLRLYLAFLLWKLWYHPLKILRQPFDFLRRRFHTKMEMVPYRAMVLKTIECGKRRDDAGKEQA